MELKEAERIIREFSQYLLPVAEKVLEAHKILILGDIFKLADDAKERGDKFIVVPLNEYRKIKTALFPHAYMETYLADLGYEHTLIKSIPCFVDTEDISEIKKAIEAHDK